MRLKIFKTKRKPPTGDKQQQDGAVPSSFSSSSHSQQHQQQTSSQDKAKARRAQVRRAQVEHRQRKANYVKQLELDVARIRDMIAAAQADARRLQAENGAMRSRLLIAGDGDGGAGEAAAAAAVVPHAPTQGQQQSVSSSSLLLPRGREVVELELEPPEPASLSFLDDLQLDNLSGLKLSLGLDEVMNLPAYRISGGEEASSSSSSAANRLPPPQEPPRQTEPRSHPFAYLSPEQAQQIINFILALEHICWDHFNPSNYQPDTAEPLGKESGHTLMATSVALRTAPAAVFDAMSTGRPVPPPQPPWADQAARMAGRVAEQTGLPPFVGAETTGISWAAGSDLTLDSLYGLAGSVNPSDLELAPVQAWFELAERYPVELLLRRDVEDRLKREFVGAVRCPHYGASIERRAFESVCARVIDPEVEAWGGGVVV